MNVIVAQSAGFCWGVRRAVELACKTAATGAASVYTDGPLIHNEHQMRRLRENGVDESHDPDTLPRGSTLIIRAHGISPRRRRHLETLPIALVDATCPDVAKIQKIVREAADGGSTVLILGDPGHAEVAGLLGNAGAHGKVVTSPRDIDALPADLGAVCLVSQSTQPEATFEATAAATLRRFPDARIVNTICQATRRRQSELATLAEQCDVFVVVGSPTSANTKRLAQIAAQLQPTVVVDSADQLEPEPFAGVATVAVTAGASTPDFVIDEVVERLKTFEPQTEEPPCKS
ncbi:MAG: 4-hydroxy-3-methylbut-2-enyl diphosphate reductase [Kiritimatiellia bacterium]|jgi:4-hydroxy-3-methylbut-2-enyl diphosphate reductase